ncbi:hypothetical protein [Deferrisoma palaeochoriense]
MKQAVEQLEVRYLVDKTGKRVGVFLPLKDFEALVEDLEDLAVAAERRDEPTISHSELLASLKADVDG